VTVTDRTSADELRDLMLALCGEAIQMGCSSWYLSSEVRRLRGMDCSAPIRKQTRDGFRRSMSVVDSIALGMPASAAFREMRAAVGRAWSIMDAEWRLGGLGL
jgi:hypothetical protein